MIGTAQNVLRELATAINHTDTGEVTVTWHTSHGRRVVETTDFEPAEPGSGDAGVQRRVGCPVPAEEHLIKPVEVTRPGVPSKDDPRVETAMRVWDYLNAAEQRETFRSLYRHVLAHKQTGDVDHLLRFAESIDLMVRLESANPGLRDKIRAARDEKPVPADRAEVAALIAWLEES